MQTSGGIRHLRGHGAEEPGQGRAPGGGGDPGGGHLYRSGYTGRSPEEAESGGSTNGTGEL